MSTLTITLTRDEIEGGTDLVLSGSSDANPIGITNYMEPAVQARIRYAPDSDDIEGSVSLTRTWQQTFLQFDVVTDQESTEAESRALLAELRAALGQFRFTATVVVDGAPAEAWACDTGSMVPKGARTLMDLEHHDPVWSVQIPCRPTPTIGA